MKKRYNFIIGFILVMLLSVNVNAAERVIYQFDPISEQGGRVTLLWSDKNTTPIQITGYQVKDTHTVEVSYRTGDAVPQYNSLIIKNDQLSYPIKIFLKQEQVTKEPLSDLPSNQEQKDHILHLYDRGVLSGYPDGTFKSNNNVSRQEFAVMMVNAAGYSLNSSTSSSFTDVKNTDWSKNHVMTLANKGIFVGKGNGQFDPKGEITIAEVLTVINRTFQVHTGATQIFTEKLSDHWSNSSYQALYESGIVKNEDAFCGPYLPSKKATRLDCTILLSRVLEQVNQAK